MNTTNESGSGDSESKLCMEKHQNKTNFSSGLVRDEKPNHIFKITPWSSTNTGCKMHAHLKMIDHGFVQLLAEWRIGLKGTADRMEVQKCPAQKKKFSIIVLKEKPVGMIDL